MRWQIRLPRCLSSCRVFVAEDATLVEVNPLVKIADGVILALDAR